MDNRLTLKDLYKLEHNHSVEQVLRAFFNTGIKDLIKFLSCNQYRLLEIWSNDNSVTTEFLINTIKIYLHSIAKFKIICEHDNDNMPLTELQLGTVTLIMNWAIIPC